MARNGRGCTRKAEEPSESAGPGWKDPRRGKNARGQRNRRMKASNLKVEVPALDRVLNLTVEECMIGWLEDGWLKWMAVHSKIY